MKTKRIYPTVCTILVMVIGLLLIANVLVPLNAPQNAKSQYFCDVALFSFDLNIDVENMSGEALYNIDGEFFNKYEDNLEMKDTDGNVVMEMCDDFNFITQNDHAIKRDNDVLCAMEGQFKMFGDTYNIFDANKEQIATLKCNMFMTSCKLLDMQGNVMAEYGSRILRSDYVVSIFDGCTIDDETVLLLFASAYSDARSDNSTSSSKSS